MRQLDAEEARLVRRMIGRAVLSAMCIGCGAQFCYRARSVVLSKTEAIEKIFTPEFRNRLDAIIPFAPLGQEVIRLVVDKFIMQLDAQLADRNVEI